MSALEIVESSDSGLLLRIDTRLSLGDLYYRSEQYFAAKRIYSQAFYLELISTTSHQAQNPSFCPNLFGSCVTHRDSKSVLSALQDFTERTGDHTNVYLLGRQSTNDVNRLRLTISQVWELEGDFHMKK